MNFFGYSSKTHNTSTNLATEKSDMDNRYFICGAKNIYHFLLYIIYYHGFQLNDDQFIFKTNTRQKFTSIKKSDTFFFKYLYFKGTSI